MPQDGGLKQRAKQPSSISGKATATWCVLRAFRVSVVFTPGLQSSGGLFSSVLIPKEIVISFNPDAENILLRAFFSGILRIHKPRTRISTFSGKRKTAKTYVVVSRIILFSIFLFCLQQREKCSHSANFSLNTAEANEQARRVH